MATISFGTSCSPRRGASAERDQVPDDDDVKGNDDPEKLLPCPFDKNHLIRSCRFPYHLIKCRKNHPKLASQLKTCPYNARHLVRPQELSHHMETCEDRTYVVAEDRGSADGMKWKVPVSVWVNPNMTENWEEEADDSASPFVWGENSVLRETQETTPVNSLGPGARTPATLPWAFK